MTVTYHRNDNDWQQQQQPPSMTRAQADELLRRQRTLERRSGCLWALVMTWFFGVFYWAWRGLKLAVRATWALTVLGWRWTVALARWTWRGSVALAQLTVAGVRRAAPIVERGVRMFYARYGARGISIAAGVLAAVLVLLVLVGALIGRH